MPTKCDRVKFKRQGTGEVRLIGIENYIVSEVICFNFIFSNGNRTIRPYSISPQSTRDLMMPPETQVRKVEIYQIDSHVSGFKFFSDGDAPIFESGDTTPTEKVT